MGGREEQREGKDGSVVKADSSAIVQHISGYQVRDGVLELKMSK